MSDDSASIAKGQKRTGSGRGIFPAIAPWVQPRVTVRWIQSYAGRDTWIPATVTKLFPNSGRIQIHAYDRRGRQTALTSTRWVEPLVS